MFDFGFCLHPVLHPCGDCSGTLKLWVATDADSRFIPTDYDLSRREWDAAAGWIDFTGCTPERQSCLMGYTEAMARDLSLMDSVVRSLEAGGRYTARDAIRQWHALVLEKEAVPAICDK